MFEDFSFTSSRPPRLTFDTDDRLMVDGDSTLISPLSSRCPSPSPSQSQRFPRTVRSSLHLRAQHQQHQHQQQQQPPTSVPPAYDNRRLSIGTLTRKLHEHTLRNSEDNYYPRQIPEDACVSPRSIPDLVPGSGSGFGAGFGRLPGYFLTPPDTDHDDDGDGGNSSITDGDYFSSVRTSPSSLSHPQSPFLSPTSAESHYSEFMSQTPSSSSPGDQVRAQRQQISQMQCNPADIETIRRALLSSEDDSRIDPFGQDEWHPSSLPPRRSPRRRAATLQRSRSRPVVLGHGSGSGSGGALPEQQQYSTRGRRKSSSGALMSSSSSNRIDKSYNPSSRDLRKKSEQGLRRKSLVSAALASMVEKSL